MAKRSRKLSGKGCDIPYLDATPDEHAQEYLEAIWMIQERTQGIARISAISDKLGVAPPSVVEMLRRLEKNGHLEYRAREGVKLLAKGRKVGRTMVRNGRLTEVFMKETLRIPIDSKVACGIEHHLTERFADALCTLLNHPKECPHGYSMPPGKCCRVANPRSKLGQSR